ncbi:MAG: hypothetical protein EA401_00715 [Planctomycetota bacterium]|nr:MAG: hypothetical protein EA401_00715 [Planctomycetota bacterium]
MTSMLNKADIIKAIVGYENASCSIKSTPTITVTDGQEEMLGFCSGEALEMVLVEMLNEYLGAINQQRIQRLQALLHHDQPPSLSDVVAACIEPLVDGLSGPDACIVQFCHRAILLDGIDIDQALWWTPTLTKTLKAASRNNEALWRGHKASTLNFALYHFIGRILDVRKNPIPFNSHDRQSIHDWLSGVTTAILQPPLHTDDSGLGPQAQE